MVKINFSPLYQLQEFKTEAKRLWNSPPLNQYTPQITQLWTKYGFYFKLALLGLLLVSLVTLGINFGRQLAQQTILPQYQPAPLPTLTIPSPSAIQSQFQDLKKQIQTFSTLLPDPAPPGVDEKISLEKLTTE